MRRRHLELAAKIWGFALIAHTSEGHDADSTKVRKLASKRAATKLRKIGTDPSEILSEDDAIAKAEELLTPPTP